MMTTLKGTKWEASWKANEYDDTIPQLYKVQTNHKSNQPLIKSMLQNFNYATTNTQLQNISPTLSKSKKFKIAPVLIHKRMKY